MPRSIRGRIAVATTLVVALALALSGLVLLGSVRQQALARLDAELRGEAELITAAARTLRRPGPDGDGGSPGPTRPGTAVGPGAVEALRDIATGLRERDRYTVIHPDGPGGDDPGPDEDASPTVADVVLGAVDDAVGRGPGAELPRLGAGEAATFRADRGAPWRVVAVDLDGPFGGLLLVATPLADAVTAPLRDLARSLLAVGAAAIALAALSTAAVVGASTRPLGRLGEATRRVAETEDLTIRVPTDDAPTEIAGVGEGLNTMLARLQRSRDAQQAALHGAQRFAADAGHELRTPLTAMQANLDALQRNPDAPADVRQDAIGEVAAETRRLSGLLAALQTLARADAGVGADHAALDLADLVEEAAGSARVRHPDVTWRTVGTDGPSPVTGTEPWLRSIVDNLLTNAAVHGRPDGTVTVRIEPADGEVRVAVEDDGPGIPSARREQVFSRFVRGADADDRPGSGLGLSLVAQLTALHGGSVRIEDGPGGGARVVVSLPT